MPETRTYWLSFADGDRPSGQQFLGVCVVDVTDADVAAVRDKVRAKFPKARDGAEWIAAASRAAWAHGCNPGGEMLVYQLNVPPTDRVKVVPRNRLLTASELVEFAKPIHA